MWKKLLSINITNVLAAGVSFVFNFLLLRLLGLDGFAEFYILMSKLNLFFLVFVLLPSSYSIFRLQDDQDYPAIFLSFNIYVNVILAVLVFMVFRASEFRWGLTLFVITNGLQTYVDAILQARSKTGLFFRLLVVASLVRLGLIAVFYFGQKHINMSEVWLFYSAGQLAFVAGLYFDNIRGVHLVSLRKVTDYISGNIKVLRQYYLYAALKRIQDNSPLVLFDFFVSKEIIGLFALLQKPLIFFISSIRTLESFLTSRENFQAFYTTLTKYMGYLSVLLSLAFVPFCALYMFIYTGDMHIGPSLLMAGLIPIVLTGTLLRVEKMAAYHQTDLTISSCIFIVFIAMLSLLFYWTGIVNVYSVLSTYVLSSLFSIGYLYYLSKRKGKTQIDVHGK